MSKFFQVTISNIKKEADSSVVLRFKLTDELKKEFNFKSGQYITLSTLIDGKEVRRPYSICSIPNDNFIEVGVKKIIDGKMSTFLNNTLKVGDFLSVMPPTGNFFLDIDSNNNKHYVGICAGSGITPIISMIKNVLYFENDSSFTLIYGNKTYASTMFLSELEEMKQKYPGRFKINYFFSREKRANSINGRLNKESVHELFKSNLKFKNASSYFLCGPGEMIDQISDLLFLYNIPKNNINFERFSSTSDSKIDKSNDEIISEVTVIVDGDEFDFELNSNSDTILDAAIEEGADVPFSCKGAVCCTCKAKVIEGDVIMQKNFSLSKDEVDEGFILGCQAHPISKKVIVDFDVI